MSQPGFQASQAAGGQRTSVPMYKPEVMRTLPFLTDEEKVKYEKGLKALWQLYETSPEGSEQKQHARKKIQDFAAVLMNKLRDRKAQGQAQGQGQGGIPSGGQVPAAGAAGGAGQMGVRPNIPNAAGPATSTAPGAAPGPTAPGPQQSMQQPRWADGIVALVNKMSFRPPPSVTGDAIPRWVEEAKKKYANALTQMEKSRNQIHQLEGMVKARQERGPMTPEEQRQFQEKRVQIQKSHDAANAFTINFRKQQEAMMAQAAAQGKVGGAGAQPQASAQQAGKGPAPGPTSMQNSQANINGAIDAAKKEQVAAAGRMPSANGLPSGQQQAQGGQAPSAGPPVQTPIPPPQPPTSAQIKAESSGQSSHPHPPPVNTVLAAAGKVGLPSAGTPTQNSARVPPTPQSAGTPLGPGGVPRALSHQKALEEANRQRANSTSGPLSAQAGLPGTATGTPQSAPGVMGATPQQPGHTHAHPTANQTTSTMQSKLPIPKNLPERSTAQPQPVALGGGITPGRPTYTGGGGIAGGVMSQPAIAKIPAIQMEGEGERVLNKKKLDELVRQVCGGTAEGQEVGNLLAPEVEEVRRR
jgi:transcription initiation factor TFIID subunit 12